MIISYDYELCFIGLVILWIHHCNCTAACGRHCRLVVHCDNSSSCLKFAFAQTFVKEALCNDITCRSTIYLKFDGLFPKNASWQTIFVGIVVLLQHSFAARVSVRAHLGHHNRFQHRCTLRVLSEVDKHSPSWALRDRQLQSDLFCCSLNILPYAGQFPSSWQSLRYLHAFLSKVCGCLFCLCLPVTFDPLLRLL